MTTVRDPAGGHALIASLTHSQRVLHRVRYAHTQLRLLLETGESRFLGRALDELADAEKELEEAEAATTHAAAEAATAAGLRRDSDILALIEFVPDDVGYALVQVRGTIQDLLAEVNAERASARALSHALVVHRHSGGQSQA